MSNFTNLACCNDVDIQNAMLKHENFRNVKNVGILMFLTTLKFSISFSFLFLQHFHFYISL